ncbi:DNA cytosine methyltransferase [Sphingomonas sp. TREG-RG-20F-R18-01]|uniref:DNA cytosine methyltransferase n=1 Tax=Sphingomonas sp. TREG-RG-20F-R18-01 TaxID=2914982 RepID=UPI001F5858CD|nr:DNA cytosine methyltransferase [Sphingomonas sp. TREG-RG-20F-R18-01]
MRYLDVCAGISASSVAWKPLGWEAAAYSEIEPAPRAVLAHHYPNTPLHGDFTTIRGDEYGPIDLLVGGTPCQDNSVGYAAGAGVAGSGFDGSRSGLARGFVELTRRSHARWFVWENVPNVLCARLAPGFIRFVRSFAELGYGVAWRVVDSRGAGGPLDQPRRRVIMVGYRGSAATAGQVLFEQPGVARDRASRPAAAPVLTRLGSMAFDDRTPCVLDGGRVRIATPREWERSLGFPDDYTLAPYRGKPMADGPRYKALGNSMAVPVMRWIGERIAAVDALEIDERIAA